MQLLRRKVYLIEKGADKFIDKMGEWLDENKGQRILLKCFKEYLNEVGSERAGYELDKKTENMILSVSKYRIQPNAEMLQLMNDLEGLFRECIITDDKEVVETTKTHICSMYLNQARNELLCLYHLDDDIHKVDADVLKNRELSEKQHKEVLRLLNKLQNSKTLYFIDQLDDARKFGYICIEVSKSLWNDDYEYFRDILYDRTEIPVELEQFTDNGVDVLIINFCESISQGELKKYLVVINQLFKVQNIDIFNVTSH